MNWGKGLLKLGKYFGGFFRWFVTFLTTYKKLLPVSLLGVFLVQDFLTALFTKGITEAFISFAQKILAAEQTINYHVNLAISNSPEYTLYSVYAILVSLYMFWVVFKFWKNFTEKIQGANQNYGAIFIALLIVGILEAAVMNFTEGVLFIPIKDGIIFLAMNLTPVLQNINYFGVADTTIITAKNLTNNITGVI